MSRTLAVALLLVLAVPSTAAAAVKARGSVEQVQVTGAMRGSKVTLAARSGKRVSQRAGRLGGTVFRNVKPGRRRVGVSLRFGPSAASLLVLPVVAGIDAPTALPPCPALRGQPCRPYDAIVNGG